MDNQGGKLKKNLFMKALERCKSLRLSSCRSSATYAKLNMTKSFRGLTRSSSDGMNKKAKESCQVAPVGHFSVYVGPEKQRFVIKTKFANHPLFKFLLEAAETEYGFDSEGPIMIPCDVDLFYKVLEEIMENFDESTASPTCNALVLRSPFTPTRRCKKAY